MSNDQSYMGSIQLPDTNLVFRNINKAKQFALDIGGSLTKIAYYSTVSCRKIAYNTDAILPSDEKSAPSDSYSYQTSEIERLHFVKFETKYIEHCLNFIHKHFTYPQNLNDNGRSIKVTGGGAYKYADLIKDQLGLSVEKEDEFCCLIKGCNFLLRNVPHEQFHYSKHDDPEYRFVNSDPNIFPYVLVNIGSGVSIIKVEGEKKYVRIGGTSLGGGTFWGLGSLLTKAKGFDDLLQLASEGDHRNIDLLVRDIYGGSFEKIGLGADIIASSFGKAMHTIDHDKFSEADIARSLLFTVSNEIGQLASLYAMLHNIKKVYFGGYFLRNHPVSMQAISYAINFWSKGAVNALFLRHEGYLGAIGAFLKGAEECDTNSTWDENYAGSSGLKSPIYAPFVTSSPWATVDQLEMDKCDQPHSPLPLLDQPKNYVPDTVDLILDREAREYWLKCFENSLESLVERAINSQLNTEDAILRGEKFKNKFLHRLSTLSNHPFAYGNLTVRSLLDMREHCLNEFDFPDPFMKQKNIENDFALGLFKKRLEYLDGLERREKWEALICGILSGNIFDWGAKEVVKLMQNGLSFEEAGDRLQKRPWLRDDLSLWLDRQELVVHRCALVFVDNSGCDLILGIIPFIRELLKRGTKVILCANSRPVLNDVTAVELRMLIKQVAAICPVVDEYLNEGSLFIRESGQGSPCLDLSRLPQSLVEEVVELGCDLVVLEGMGRALHTNLNALLSCDTLKLAVIKNKWLAERLGGEMFAVICKFEPRQNSKSNSPETHSRDIS